MSHLDFALTSSVPVIVQSEVAECGLACIAMVSSYLGHPMDISALRKKFSTSLKGITLKNLMHIAEESGLSSRAVRCDLDELVSLNLPAILHWDLNHFVVLTKVTGSGYWIHDPTVGKRKLTTKECSQRFTGVALELRAGAKFTQEDETIKMSVWQLWSKTTYLYRALGVLFAVSVVIQLLGIAAPYYMQWVVDHVLVTADRDLLVVLAMGFGLLMLASALIASLRSWLVLRLSSTLSLQMGVNLLRHLLRLPLEFFEKRHIGDVVSRFSSLGQVRERITTGIVETIVDGVMSLMVLVVMMFYSVPLTLVVIGAVLLYTLVRIISYGPLYRASEIAIRISASEQSSFLETIRGIQTIKLFAAEGHRLSLWQNQFTDVINCEIKLGKLSIGFSLVSGMIFGVENILIVYLAALAVLADELSIGMVLAFLAYKGQLSGRLSNLVEQWIAFRMLRLHLNRLADIALAEPESSHAGSPSLPTDSGTGSRLEVQHLSYRYGDHEPLVLDDFNFDVSDGEVIAIVGPSGGGKTTLIKLLCGLLMPDSGRILFDGVDIRQLGLHQYRRQLGVVMQNDTLLTGTVLENISFFDLEPNLLRVRQCARLASIDDEISASPMGYYSLVGDMGNQFSGGQIQRLLLARALYQQPRVLLLDEATSHLDVANECHIAQQIRALTMTRIIVAHRPETIREADRVLLVERGKLSQVNASMLQGDVFA
ncbi:MAG: ATP-binding cassette subfamily B protein RaxB [Candidatus Azotimanducaceae bacterium]|jgi:ATP-binding cassette subfamily B protein RaxB